MRDHLRDASRTCLLPLLLLGTACGGGGGGGDEAPGPAELMSLAPSQGSLAPEFSPAVELYTVGPRLLDEVATLTPIAGDPGQTVEINGLPTASRTPSVPIDLLPESLRSR